MTTTTNLGLNITSEAAGSAVTFLEWRMYQDGNLSSNALKIDEAYGEMSGSLTLLSSGITGSLVTGGNAHDHLGGDGGTIAHTSLSGSGTTSHTDIDAFIASKAALGGIASLDASGSVVQNPVNATETPTAGKIPLGNASGRIDKWITHKVHGLISNPQAVYAQRAQIIIMKTDAALTITRIHVSLNTTSYNIAGDLKFADDTQGFTGATLIETCDTISGTFTETSTFTDATVPSTKYIYFQLDSSPNANIKDIYIEVFYTYD